MVKTVVQESHSSLTRMHTRDAHTPPHEGSKISDDEDDELLTDSRGRSE